MLNEAQISKSIAKRFGLPMTEHLIFTGFANLTDDKGMVICQVNEIFVADRYTLYNADSIPLLSYAKLASCVQKRTDGHIATNDSWRLGQGRFCLYHSWIVLLSTKSFGRKGRDVLISLRSVSRAGSVFARIPVPYLALRSNVLYYCQVHT